MKKLALTAACTMAMTGLVLAQGNVNWTGPTAAAFTAQTNSTQYSPLFGGGSTGGGSVGSTSTTANSFYYELLYTSYSGSAATINSLSSLLTWSDSGLGAVNGTVAGRVQDVNPNSGAQVPWSPGTTDNIVMIGWSANLGTTWAAVSAELQAGTYGANSFFGVSTVGYTTTASTSTVPGATLFGTSPTALGVPIDSLLTQLYILPTAPVPEPTTLALAGLGSLSLLMLRRRK